MFALMLGVIGATNAQESTGDLYHGLTKKVTYDRMIPPHGIEVTYDKTVHIIFPSAVKYCGLGFTQSDSRQGGRSGKCNPCESHS